MQQQQMGGAMGGMLAMGGMMQVTYGMIMLQPIVDLNIQTKAHCYLNLGHDVESIACCMGSWGLTGDVNGNVSSRACLRCQQ